MSGTVREIETAEGATFSDLFDTSLPSSYGDPEAEYWGLRRGCGLLDAGFRSMLVATGEDRGSFLQGMLTNDVKSLAPNRGVGAAHLTVQGRVISDMRVYALEDALWIDVPVHRREALRTTLERFIVADDVELNEPADVSVLLCLEGPRSIEVGERLFGRELSTLPPMAMAPVTFSGHPLRVAAVSHAGEAGLVIYGPPVAAAPLWNEARALGAVPVGMDALNVARIESGVPWYGFDMDESLIAPEVGLAEAISFTKGCYIGQEVVERAVARGRLQKKLVQLMCSGRIVPELGTRLLQNGDDIGWITSAAWSPAFKAIVGLCYVRRSAWDAGTVLEVLTLEPGTAVVGIPARQV